MIRPAAAKIYIAGTATKLICDPSFHNLIDKITEATLAKEWDKAETLVNTLQHDTPGGLRLTPYCFLVRTNLKNDRMEAS